MEPADLPQVLAIENASFPVPFSENLFRMELSLKVANLTVAKGNGVIFGYIDYWHVEDEFHLITFAVHPDFRQRHIGGDLMNFMLDEARRKAVRKITLDVRPTNTAALALYAKLGFRQIAVRKGYYQDNQEDALVLSLEFH